MVQEQLRQIAQHTGNGLTFSDEIGAKSVLDESFSFLLHGGIASQAMGQLFIKQRSDVAAADKSIDKSPQMFNDLFFKEVSERSFHLERL